MLKLIATDMDGTFLRRDMTYDRDRFDRLYKQLQQQEIRFVVASGNQYAQLKSFFPQFADILYIADNGAYIRDAWQVYATHTFADETLAKILEKILVIPNLQVLISGVTSAYVRQSENPNYISNMRHYYHRLAIVDSFANLPDKAMKISITCNPADTDQIVTKLGVLLANLAEPTSSGHGDIDIIQPGRNKAAGLQELGRLLNIDLPEMAAFGDGGNDLEMIREVGLGVAMENAQTAVKRVADATTTTNEKQGVLTFIEQKLVNRQ